MVKVSHMNNARSKNETCILKQMEYNFCSLRIFI